MILIKNCKIRRLWLTPVTPVILAVKDWENLWFEAIWGKDLVSHHLSQ
jgi:hypothetical protein